MQKTTGNMRNQGNMPSQKENIHFPITELQGMEFFDLANNEFKIAVLKKLNELQENAKRQFKKISNYI